MYKEGTEKKRNRRLRIQPKRLLFISFVFVASFLAGFLFNHDNYSKISWDSNAEDSKISAIADGGAFADDVKMVAEKVDDSEITKIARRTAGQGVQDVLAYNITFTDKDSKEVQPNSRVKVTINPKDYEFKAQRYALVHIDDNHEAKYLGNVAATSKNELSFYANSFSIYAIIPTRETDQQRYARYTYEFYVDSERVASQIVRDGDILNAPPAPYKEDLIFMGWYRENDKLFNDLNQAVNIPDSIQTDKTIKLHARFADKIYSVIFYNPQGNVLATKTGTTGDTFDTDEYRYEVSAGFFVESWTTDSSVMDYYDIDACDHQCSVPNTVTIPDTIRGNLTFEEQNLKLYPIVREVQWVHYHTNDHDADEYTAASYTPSDYAFYGYAVSRPTDPRRNGYTFAGWTTDEAGNNLYDFSTPLTSNVDLYAQWTPRTNTQYRVVYWKETLDENSNYVEGNYTYAAHYDNTGTSGATITVPQSQINQVLNRSDMEYYEFDYAEDGAVIHGDGSTIVNVYLKLHVYTVNFVIETTTNSGGRTRYCMNYYNANNSLTTLCQNTSYSDDANLDIHYTNGSPHDLKGGYSFQARMGQNISTLYPGVGQVVINYTGANNTIAGMLPYAWRAVDNNPTNTTRISKPITMTSDLIRTNGTGATLYLITTIASTHVVDVNYWFEKPDGSGYERSEDYSFTANSNANSFNGRNVTGYELLNSTPPGYSGSSGNTFNFYYKRNTYSLNFYNYNTAGESYSNIRHGANLTNYDYIPERPTGLEDAFTFQGWYTTPEHIPGTEFDLTTDIMPMSNLMLYAKWENTHYVTVSFNSNGGNAIPSQSVLYGAQARAVDDPARTGYVFVGWRKTDGTFFSFDNIILEDTQLVASWVPFDTINIDYDPNGGVLGENDQESYVDTSTTAILPPPEEAPEGKYFVGWNVNGRIYYPGNVVMVLLSDIPEGSDTLTIVAEWGKEVEKTVITYDPNTGTGQPTSFTLEQNQAFIVQNASDLDFEKVGHTFKGWNTQADGSGFTLKADTQWAADQRASLPNVLYAEWELNCHTLTVKHIYANGDKYDETETSEVCYNEHYETHPSEKDSNYAGRVTSGVPEGDMPDNNVTVVYTYSKREAVITVNHVDEDGQPLAEAEYLPVFYGDEYTINPNPDLTPYYNVTPEQATGTVSGNTTITFTYTKKNFTLTVRHLYDSDGSEYDATFTDSTYKYLDPYSASPSTKDSDYKVVRTDGEAEGTIRGDTTVTYYYAKKKATITTLHLGEEGEELARPEHQTVEYGEYYNTHPAESLTDAYTYETDKPESAEVHSDVTVTYTYKIKKFTLKVTHRTEDGTILNEDTDTLEYGTHYKKNPLNRPDYVLVNTIGVTEDDIVSDVEIVFVYKKATFTVTIIHEIEDADDITETKTVEYGDACPAQPKQDLLTAYTYTQSGDTCGDSVTSNLTVKYTYTRKHFTLKVNYLDESGTTFDSDESDHKYGDHYGEITVKDDVAKAYTCTTNDPTSGTITSNTTITFNCTKRHFKLTTHHIKADGSEFRPDVIKDDYEYDDEYTALPINDPAYNHVVTQGSATGIIHNDTEVTFTYTKKTFTVTIIHEIEDADDITETKTVEYGDACPAQPKQDLLTAYTYTQSGDACGDSVTSNLTVKYTYTLKRINLIVRHLNSSGGEIIPDQPHEYKYGASYNNIQPDPSLEQAYVCTTNDPTSGTIVAETTITFNCVKRKYTVTVHHIKSDGTKYAEDTVKSYDYGSDYTTAPIEDNNYTSELTEGTASGTVNGNIEVTYTYTRKIATIIVHHVDENGNPFVGVDDVIFTKPFGDNYETEASTDIPANYEFASRTNNHAGVVSSTPIEVTYRYQKKDPNLSTTVKIKNGNDTLTNESSTSEYDVVYNATVDGFYGSATIEIVNKLPYPVDQDNSDFGGGIYDPETNTITWTETVDVDTVPKNITVTKPVKIVFKNVDPNDRAVNNRVSATTTLDTGKERTSTGDATISVEYTSKAIVHYYLKDTETSIKDDKEYTGLVGDEFTVKAVTIKGYKLVDSSPAKTYYFTTEVQEIIFEYTKIEPPAPTPKPENPNTDDGFSPLAFIGFSLFSTIGIGLVLRSLRLRRS